MDDPERAPPRRGTNALVFGTEYTIDLGRLSCEEEDFTVPELMVKLRETATLTDLNIYFGMRYTPTPENMRQIVSPICKCISSWRHQNNRQVLRKLKLSWLDLSQTGMVHVYELFMIAAKRGGIRHLHLSAAQQLPVHSLVRFCSFNRHVKVLHIFDSSFSAGVPTRTMLPEGVPGRLTKLIVDAVSFDSPASATMFANAVALLKLSSLELGMIICHRNDGLTTRIVSNLMLPLVEELALASYCSLAHVGAALEAGKTKLTDLAVWLSDTLEDNRSKLALLARLVNTTGQLNSLMIGARGVVPEASKRSLFQAIDACTTITEIQVDTREPQLFGPEERQQLHGFARRNRELRRFRENPSAYPSCNLLPLVTLLENRDSDRYELVRQRLLVILGNHG